MEGSISNAMMFYNMKSKVMHLGTNNKGCRYKKGVQELEIIKDERGRGVWLTLGWMQTILEAQLWKRIAVLGHLSHFSFNT